MGDWYRPHRLVHGMAKNTIGEGSRQGGMDARSHNSRGRRCGWCWRRSCRELVEMFWMMPWATDVGWRFRVKPGDDFVDVDDLLQARFSGLWSGVKAAVLKNCTDFGPDNFAFGGLMCASGPMCRPSKIVEMSVGQGLIFGLNCLWSGREGIRSLPSRSRQKMVKKSNFGYFSRFLSQNRENGGFWPKIHFFGLV